MIIKFALCEIIPLDMPVSSDGKVGIMKTASGRVFVEPDSDKARVIESEIEKHPTSLFFRAKAIKADEPNSNGDYFSEEELLKAYKSFEGVPFFTNHDNQNVENARGKIIFAEWDPKDKAVYTIAFVDREAFPHICRSIEEDYVTGVSMGALSGGSMILLPDLTEKPIEDIIEGDIVLSHLGTPRKVKTVHNEYLGKPMYKMNIGTYHRSPMFTEDHPILTIDKDVILAGKRESIKVAQQNKHERRENKTDDFIGQDGWRLANYDAKFKQTNCVSEGDCVLIPSKYSLQKGISFKTDFYYLVGAFLGDGYLKKDKTGQFEAVSFCIGKDEIELCQKIHELIKKYSDAEPHDLVCEERNGLYISVYDRKLAKWFSDNIGTGSKIKRIKLPIKFVGDAEQLLAGYLDTDGCIVNKSSQKTRGSGFGGFQISSVNIGLLEDVQQLLISLGYISRISTFARVSGENSVVKIDTIENTLAIGSNASSVFNNSIKYSNSLFGTAEIKAGNSFITYIEEIPFMACPVKSIEIKKFEEAVYDLTVEEDESYIADGLAVHNCSVEYSICNICGNKAEKTEDYCSHIKERKGRTFSGKARNVRSGEAKDFKNELVFEYNYGIKFIELSAVVDPACPTCRIEGLLANDDYMRRVATVENSLRMIKMSAIEKEASQEEIDQLNQVLTTLESIAVSLIQNRQQVEVEFASDLVAILSDLQKFVDELIGAGYSNVQGVPGVADSPDGLMLPDGGGVPAAGGVPAGLEASPVAAETPIADIPVGTVSGSPSKPLVQPPQLPITAPAKPIAFDSKKLKKVAGLLGGLQKISDKMRNKGEDNMGERRTLVKRKEQAKVATEVLSNLWKEKQKFFAYINRVPSIQDNEYKLSVKKRDDSFVIVAEDKGNSENQKNWTFEDLTDKEKKMVEESPKEAALYFLDTFANSFKTNIKEGDTEMTDNIREAGAQSTNKSPEVITEKQLDGGDLYHARTDAEQNVITEKQLDGQRSGEKDVITEKQLEEKSNKLNPRKDEEKEVITEAQLQGDASGVSSRKDNAPNVVTQKQLDDYRGNKEPDVITEKQLDSVDTPWERAASRDSSLFKSAGEHMQAVIDVLADSAISTGCTPQEVSGVAESLIGSTKDRFELGNAVLDKAQEEDVDYSKRLAYWSAKNIKVAGVGSKEIAETIVRGLRRIASDITINPEIIIDALDVATEGDEGIEAISKKIDDKLEEAKTETVKASKKAELRTALKGNAGKEKRDEERKEIEASLNKEDNKLTREAERALWEKGVEEEKRPDTMIETNFEEIGCSKDAEGFRPAIKSFARGALASQNIKLAAITNVTINGDTISIAVQTDGGEEAIDIPIGEEIAPIEEEIVPEGDLAGEGLEMGMGELGKVSPQTGLPIAASKKQGLKKQAQSPMGGGVPGTPGEVAGGPGGLAGGGVPGGPPMDTPIESLTVDEKVVSDEIPTAGEQQMPYAICPECGSSDVDIEKEASGGIKGGCNNCGAEYEALVKKAIEFKIVKPTRSIGEEGTVGDLESPEVPALPVAAQTKLDKDVIVRVASNQQKHGHVCPACGMNQCKVASEEGGHTEYTCPACGTDVEKDVVINVNDPDESYLRVKWDVVPNLENCEGCDEDATKFASMIKIEKMMKQATSGETEFPMANCIERIALVYGGNTTATFGPCKGKLLTDCVCGQLKRLGLTKVRHMERLASVYTQKDPMDECINDQMKKDFDRKEAENICNCLKKKFASEEDDNIFVQAFADDIKSGKEKILTAQDLGVINDLFVEEAPEVEDFEDTDIGDAIEETVTIEVSKATAEELANAAADAVVEVEVDVDLEVEGNPEIVEEIPETTATEEIEVASDSTDKIEINTEEEKDMVEAMKSHKLRRVGDEIVKVAGEPKVVENIEGNVRAGVPRAKATMGEEGADNIDVPMAKPSIPRANAEMGNESSSNINPAAGLPNVAVDSSYMGVEKSVQKDMPAINNEIKGTVIAEKDGKNVKEAKQLKEVETVEQDVRAGVPRAKATMGEEGADNIDVPMAKPSIPRANAEMGNESADNINPKAVGPDVPVDSAYMGAEKAVQKDMPPINDEILKNVQQNINKEKQQERISSARRMKATEVTSKLLATNRIPEEAYEDVIDALSNFEIDKIAVKADTMYPRKAVRANQDPNVHSIPAIVMESKKIKSSDPVGELADRIASHLTIGNKSFDENLTVYGEK